MLPKRPMNQVTGDQAVNIFREAALEMGWIFRELNKDYGIDAEIEVTDPCGRVTGAILRFQIKGRKKAQGSSVSVSVSALRYWMISPIPVFVVQVLLESKQILILDVRDYVENIKRLDLEIISSKTVSLDFSHALQPSQWRDCLAEIAISHQKAALDLSSYTIYNPVLEFISCNRLFRQHGGDIDAMIRWYRSEVPDRQLMYEFGHAVYLRERIIGEPGFLDALRDYVFADDPENNPKHCR